MRKSQVQKKVQDVTSLNSLCAPIVLVFCHENAENRDEPDLVRMWLINSSLVGLALKYDF